MLSIEILLIQTAFANSIAKLEVRKACYADKKTAQERYTTELAAIGYAIHEMATLLEQRNAYYPFNRDEFVKGCFAETVEQRNRLPKSSQPTEG